MANRRAIVARALVYGGLLLGGVAVVRHPDVVQRRLGLGGARTVSSVLAEHRARVEAKYRPIAEASGAAWPPTHLELIALKTERKLEVWAGARRGALARLATFPIEAASGRLGPKAREGDGQVPEGMYALPRLNPNSQFLLSLFVDYPNADDIARSTLPAAQRGGDIFVHGGAASIGCIAIGDAAITDVFTLAALVDDDAREIVIAPFDLRAPPTPAPALPVVPGLYEELRAALEALPSSGRQAGLAR